MKMPYVPWLVKRDYDDDDDDSDDDSDTLIKKLSNGEKIERRDFAHGGTEMEFRSKETGFLYM